MAFDVCISCSQAVLAWEISSAMRSEGFEISSCTYVAPIRACARSYEFG
jgi:hypothetical protein